jgi:hypothetical protein
MKKNIKIPIFFKIGFILITFLLFSCSEEEKNNPTSQTQSISNAQNWFEENYALDKGKTSQNKGSDLEINDYIKNIQWDKAVISNGNEGEVLEVPFSVLDKIAFSVNNVKSKKEYHRLMFFKDINNSFKVFHVLIRPDSTDFNNFNSDFNYYNVNFNGSVLVLDGVNKARTIKKFKNGTQNKQSLFSKPKEEELYTCTYYGWWNDDGSFDAISLVGCTGNGTGGTIYGGGTPGGGSGSVQTVVVNPNASVLVGPRLPIRDIAYYLQCFDFTKGATVTIYVDQPAPNSTAAWVSAGTSADVGHTFIAIQQGLVRRVLGFYPAVGVNPLTSSSDVSQLAEDGGHHFDVAISIPVSSNQLLSIVNYTLNAPSTYDLNTYNCTDYGMNISALAGVNLASAYGTWPNGGGDNPGQLGENMRTMQLPSNVTKQTTGASAGTNKGTCIQH